MLWKANLRPAKKVGLMVLFSGGIFVTTAAILRCVLIITNPVTGAQQAGSWACRETFVAVVTSNLPMVFPLMRRWGSPLFSSMRSASTRSKNTGGNSGGNNTGGTGRSVNGMFILEDKNPRRGMGPRSVNPLPNMTFSESEEQIYNEQLQQQQIDLEQLQQNERKQQRRSRTSKQSGHNIDLEHQALSSRPSFQAATSSSGTGSAAVATVVRSGITKQVVLQITEEERQRRRSTFGASTGNGTSRTNNASDTDSGNSMDMLEAMIPGARQGNYFLTENNTSGIQQKQRSSNTRSGDANSLSTSAASAASPLAATSWDGKPTKESSGDMGVDDTKRGSMGLTPSSRRR